MVSLAHRFETRRDHERFALTLHAGRQFVVRVMAACLFGVAATHGVAPSVGQESLPPPPFSRNPAENREELPATRPAKPDATDAPAEETPQRIAPSDPDVPRRKTTRTDAPPIVVDVIIRGTRNEERARSFIRTRKEHEYDAETVQNDVRRLITSGRFRNAKPYIKDVDGGKVVIFEVFERPMINYINVVGNRNYSNRVLTKKSGLKLGEPLNAFDVDEGRRRIEEHYQTNGYSKVRVGVFEGDKPEDQGVTYMVDEGNFQRIAAVKFKGNAFVPDGVLRTKISSLPPYLYLGWLRGKFDRAKVDADVQKVTSYYRDYGFFRARVGREIEFDEDGRWATLTFVIDEGPRYKVRDIRVEGTDIFRTGPLIGGMKLKSDKHFTRGEMERDLELLKDLYGSQGYVFADIQGEQRFTDEPGQIDMVYRINEGEPWRVGEVNVFIAGEFPHTRRNVVLNRLSIRPGDLIDIREIRDSERRLEYSQLFETPQSQPGAEGPRIVVRPPELRDAGVAARAERTRRRSQSPDDEVAIEKTPNATPVYDIDVWLPPLADDAHAESATESRTAYTLDENGLLLPTVRRR